LFFWWERHIFDPVEEESPRPLIAIAPALSARFLGIHAKIVDTKNIISNNIGKRRRRLDISRNRQVIIGNNLADF